jgi:predicted ester cyclase
MSYEETKAIMESYWAGHATECVAEDAVFTMMVSGQEDHGHEAIFRTMKHFYSEAFDGTFEGTNSFIAENNAVTEGYLVGKHVGEFAGISATGHDVRVPMCVIYDVQEGYIQKARIYFQMATFLQQIGKL